MREKTVLFLFAFILLSITTANSQELYIRAYVGQTYYQGDLSPLTSVWSISDGHPSVGVYVGTQVSKAVVVGARFTKAHISGYDEDSYYKWKLLRNLHFESPIYEFGINTEIYFNKLIPSLDRFGVNIYYTTGLNVFRFEPRAFFEGQYYELSDLSTEGQGLEHFPESKPYSQTQFSIPMGIGFSFNVADNMQLGFEVVPRMTFTDYLDDVSTVYVPSDILAAERGEVSAAISKRTWELFDADSTPPDVGVNRGNPDNNDWYLMTAVHFGYVLGKPKLVKKKRQAKPKF